MNENPSDAKLKGILDALPDLMFQVSDSGILLDYRAPDARELAYPPEAFLGKPLQAILPPETFRAFDAAARHSRETGRVQTFEYRIPIGGRPRSYEARMSRNSMGEFIVIARDITEREQTDRAKDEFLSVLSHELRTPLNAILGFGSILEDEVTGPLNPQQKKNVIRIVERAEDMREIVEHLLDLARMQAGKFALFCEENAYHELVDRAIAKLAPQAKKKRIRIERSLNVPQPVLLDGGRVLAVLTNLLDNAIKFTPSDGWVRIEARMEDQCLVTEVSDSGIGIPPEDLPKLFSPFHQLDMSPTREAGGPGLGLSIAKGIVEAHQGTLKARSEGWKKGTTFRFTIPQ